MADHAHADPAQQFVLRRGEDDETQDDDPRGGRRGELHDGNQLRTQRQRGVTAGVLHGVAALVGRHGRGGDARRRVTESLRLTVIVCG